MDALIKQLSRPMVDRHLPMLKRIDADTIGEAWADEHFRSDLPGKWTCSAIAEQRGEPVGFVIASQKAAAVHVHRIAVTASMRGTGVGTALLQYVARRALEKGLQSVTLRVASDNHAALTVYERRGFRVTATAAGLVDMMASAGELQDESAEAGTA